MSFSLLYRKIKRERCMSFVGADAVTMVELLTLLFSSAALGLSVYTFIRQRESQVRKTVLSPCVSP